MANHEHLEILLKGVGVWNEWRAEDRTIRPMLRGADLHGADLHDANLFGADLDLARLGGANLRHANLGTASLRDADLSAANLKDADLGDVDLYDADLSGADLSIVDLSRAYLVFTNLTDANLMGADITLANFSQSKLDGVNLSEALAGDTVFANIDLRRVEGLDTVRHKAASEVGLGTIYLSEGNIPDHFLLGCGIPESFILQIPALVAALQPIQFHSCFISYSGKDEEFSRRLHSRMREAKLRVWFAPEDMKGGDKIYDQIDRAIQVHDRLLLVLSESSMQSKWVETEIRRARKVELRENRRKLFPIRLVSYEALQEWVCIDSTTGEDLAEEVRSYFIPDFSNWKNHDDLEQAFARLLADLKASA